MIGIIGAMEEEVALLKERMSDTVSENIAGMNFYTGKLSNKSCVLVMSGIGKVNAAICTQILITRFKVQLIINSGIAGALDPLINIGDIVISSDMVEHDVDVSGFGYPYGQIPRMDTLAFPADKKLARLAKSCCEKVNPQISVFIGRIASGDVFVFDIKRKEGIREEFGALCTEMEGAAIAHAAYLNKIPCLIIRAISDKADGSASTDYKEFEKEAILHCSRLTMELLDRIVF